MYITTERTKQDYEVTFNGDLVGVYSAWDGHEAIEMAGGELDDSQWSAVSIGKS